MTTVWQLPDAAATQALGAALGTALERLGHGAAIALSGELGAGKTTLARALIHRLGHRGPVVSPTYTLVEPYDLPTGQLLHIDLYRLADPEELEYLGLREWDRQTQCMLVEWPEQGARFLPPFDLTVELDYMCQASGAMGRRVSMEKHSAAGRQLMAGLAAEMPDSVTI